MTETVKRYRVDYLWPSSRTTESHPWAIVDTHRIATPEQGGVWVTVGFQQTMEAADAECATLNAQAAEITQLRGQVAELCCCGKFHGHQGMYANLSPCPMCRLHNSDLDKRLAIAADRITEVEAELATLRAALEVERAKAATWQERAKVEAQRNLANGRRRLMAQRALQECDFTFTFLKDSGHGLKSPLMDKAHRRARRVLAALTTVKGEAGKSDG